MSNTETDTHHETETDHEPNTDAADSLRITESEFYMARIGDDHTIHNTRESAIDHLRNASEKLTPDPESNDVSIAVVEYGDDDWEIRELSWQTVALELLQGDAGTGGGGGA